MQKDLREAIKACLNTRTSVDSSASAVPERWVYSTCGYCATGCGMFIGVRDGKAVAVQGNPDYPVNKGHLCIKGLYEWKILHHPQRATSPMIRKDGVLVPATWEEALSLLVEKLQGNRQRSGPASIGFYHSGQLLLEEYYVLGKLAKGILGTPNIDASTRLCMAATVYGYIRSFGTDGPPGCYEDLDVADLVFIFGSNPAEMYPQLWRRIMVNRHKNGARLMVADPRATVPARVADLHLALRPGTNVPLLNALAHVLIKEGMVDHAYIAEHTTGYREFVQAVEKYPPEVAAALTGVPAEKIVEAARLFGRSPAVTTVFCQGVNQSVSAAETVTLINSLHLITGKIGKPGASPLSLTGQATTMSNRDVGGTAFLPGLRNPANPVHRQEVASVWGVDPGTIPAYTNDIMTMLEMIRRDELKFLWVMGTNPAVSLPDQAYTRKMLDKVFLVVQDIFYPMETAFYADIFLPAAQWGEKTGTYTNAERRVNVAYQAVKPPGQARADFDILVEVGRRLAGENLFPWRNTEEVFAEWKLLSRGRPNDMGGMTYRRLEKEGGLQWPCPAPGHPGTARLYAAGVFNTGGDFAQAYGPFNDSNGRARLWPVEYQPPPEIPDAEYPFWLNTGRVIEHFHTRTKTKRVPELHYAARDGFVEINPEDAKKLGITGGQKVRVVSRRGWIAVRAVVKDTVGPGQVFVPFHFGDLDPGEDHLKQAANHLTLGQVDPVSRQPMFKVAACRIEKVEEDH